LFFSQAAGVLASALGGLVLLGWWFGSEALKSIVPGSSPLKPNIAAGMLLCGALLVLLSREKISNRLRRVSWMITSVVLLVAVATLGEYFFTWDLGIDRWLVHEFPASMGTLNPGRMMPTTAFCFVLVGAALLAEAQLVPPRFRFPLVAGLSAALVMIGVLALGGFALEKLFGPRWNLLGMSLSGITASVGFMMLGSGLLALLQSNRALTWSLNTPTTVGFGLGIFVTVLTTASAFTFGRQMVETNNKVGHRQEVLKKIQEVMTDVVDLASHEWVYIITGNEQVLKEREQTKTETRAKFSNVRQLTSDNPSQQRRLDQLEPLIAQRIDWEEQMIALRRSAGLAETAESVATGPGLSLSENILHLLKEMQGEEHGLLDADRKKAEMASSATFLLLPMGVFVSLGVLSLSLFFLNAGVSEQKRSEEMLRASEERYRKLFESNPNPMWVFDLETLSFLAVNTAAVRHYGYSRGEFLAMTIKDIRPVEDIPALMDNLSKETEGLDHATQWQHRKKDGARIDVEVTSHDLMWLGCRASLVLINDITARKRAENEVLQLNADLEERVQQRTADLEAANKELEAFSYSVSHDLRAPLRAVDGFSQAVLEDFGEELSEQGRHYLQNIRGGAQQMGALIDDLLTFSRLSRLPLNKRATKTDEMVRDVMADLRSQQNGRQVDVQIGDLPPCLGDPALLKQVWLNLLSNALKYTRQRESAVIEVGCRREPASAQSNGEAAPGKDENIYFVRDNGTGFDMRYADKLFGVFQRLHRAEEFEGTGVGLAIVQRIVHRHGGRVWVDAALDRGATFFFTLEEDTTS
jgi:PAS domain S-box-containing protein